MSAYDPENNARVTFCELTMQACGRHEAVDMARRTKAESDATRQRILLAAQAAFCVTGFSGTTLDEIADAAGVTRGAVYGHFETKLKLLEAICHADASTLEKMLSDNISDASVEALRVTAAAIFATVAREKRMQCIAALLFKWNEPSAADLLRKTRNRLSRSMRAYARCCLAEARGAPTNMDIELAVVAYEAYIFGVLENWLFDPAFDLASRASELAAGAVALIGYR